MPDNTRKLIRDKTVLILKNANTAAETRVTNERWKPVQKGETFPSINVTLGDDRAEPPFEIGAVNQFVTTELQIQAMVKSNETYADDRDSLCQEIHDAIPYFLGNDESNPLYTVQSCLYQGMTPINHIEAGETFCGGIMRFDVKWVKPEGGLATNLSDLNSIHLDYDMADPSIDGMGSDEQIDAQDIISDLNA